MLALVMPYKGRALEEAPIEYFPWVPSAVYMHNMQIRQNFK